MAEGLADTFLGVYYLDISIILAGEGSWKCDELATAIVRRLITRYGHEIVIVHGDPTGVVDSFQVACKELGIRTETRVPNWRIGAPPLRLRTDELFNGGVDLCIAVHRFIGICHRTVDCVRRAVRSGIPTFLIEDDTAAPRRIRKDDPILTLWL
jgi:hypothetical protein